MSGHLNQPTKEMPLLGMGLYWNDVKVGQRFQTLGRTITETDFVNFISTNAMVEEVFTNIEYIKSESRMGARPVPGTLLMCFSEGLLMQTMVQRTGLAFLELDLKILKPSTIGDTIHVELEITEARATSKPEKGLLRTKCNIVNQNDEIVAVYNILRLVKTRPTE